MKAESEAKLLRIFIGSADKAKGRPLYEVIVYAAKQYGLAGATVLKGVMGYGANSMVHSAKIFEVSEDLPIVIELIDAAEKIEGFVSSIEKYFDKSKYGILITTETIKIVLYSPEIKN